MNLETIAATIAKLECKAGDVLVLSTDMRLTNDQASGIRAYIDTVKPEGTSVLVLGWGLELKIVSLQPGQGGGLSKV